MKEISEQVFLRGLKPVKIRKGRKKLSGGLCTFDSETTDGLIGQNLYNWGFAHFTPDSSKIQTLIGKDTSITVDEFPDTRYTDKRLQAMFEWCEERAKKILASKKSPKRKTEEIELSKRDYTVVYVHNLDFDARFILKYCVMHKIDYFYIPNKYLQIKQYGVRFVDSMQFLKCDQETAEITWDIDKILRKIDCKEIFEKPYSDWSIEEHKRVIYHNRNDVLALHQIMSKFRQEFYEITQFINQNNEQMGGVDVLSVETTAQLAMKCYRTLLYITGREIYNPFIKMVKGLDGKLSYRPVRDKTEFVRRAYFGGHTEIYLTKMFRDVVYLDANSMYPSQMYLQDFPDGFTLWLNDTSERHREIMDCCIQNRPIPKETPFFKTRFPLGFIECEIIPNKNIQHPFLPVRGIKNDVSFTNIPRIGVYTIPELQLAYKHGCEIRPIRALVYEKRSRLFKDYVEIFYQMKVDAKLSKDKGRELLAKLLLNSLYGKFGQKFERNDWKYMYFFTENEMKQAFEAYPDSICKMNTQPTNDGLWVMGIKESKISYKAFKNVAIACYTTAYGRIDLAKRCLELEAKNIPILYCDTDSICIPKQYAYLIPQNNDIGGWKIEKHYDKIQFLAPKAYIWEKDGKLYTKIKGTPKKELEKRCKMASNLQELEKLVRQEMIFTPKYMSWKEAARKGKNMLDKKIPKKHYSYLNLKRQFFADGTSIPWTGQELEIPEILIPEQYLAGVMEI